MEAGSGGIRWNSVTSKIQLMDENKNWIDWKKYNPNKAITCVHAFKDLASNTTYTFNCTNEGLHLAILGSYASSGQTINTTGEEVDSLVTNTCAFKLLDCKVGNTITYIRGNTISCMFIFYLNNYYYKIGTMNHPNTSYSANGGVSGTDSLLENDSNNFIFGVVQTSGNTSSLSVNYNQERGAIKSIGNTCSCFCIDRVNDSASVTLSSSANYTSYYAICKATIE